MRRSAFLFTLAIIATGCCFSLPVEPSRITDNATRRAEAIEVANAYFAEHRAELTPSTASVAGTRIHGGTLEAMSDVAFEVTLVLAPSDAAAAEIVVYVIAEAPSRAVGAQSRSALGAVLADLGDHLDQRFTSRD